MVLEHQSSDGLSDKRISSSVDKLDGASQERGRRSGYIVSARDNNLAPSLFPYDIRQHLVFSVLFRYDQPNRIVLVSSTNIRTIGPSVPSLFELLYEKVSMDRVTTVKSSQIEDCSAMAVIQRKRLSYKSSQKFHLHQNPQ